MKNPLDSPPNPGGSQIQDREWEKWRGVLIHLYLEDGAKLKDIVKIMAEEYKFVVTERQLRYRFFQKWNVKKNIKSRDLPMLSSAVDKQREAGQDVRIGYRGRNIRRDRIERASKRCKIMSLPSSRDLSSPFGMNFFLDQRLALASEALSGDLTGFDNFSKASSMGTTFANEYSAGGGLQAVGDNTKDVVCGMEGIVPNDELVSGVGSFGLMCTQEGLGQTPTRTSHLDLGSQYAGLVGASSTEAMNADVSWPIDMCAPTDLDGAPARSSLDCDDWAWAIGPGYCPDIQQYGGDMIVNMVKHMDVQPLFESPMPTIAPLQFPCSSSVPSISPDTVRDGLEVDAVAADGNSCDTTTPSVENLLTCLRVIRCNSISLDVLRCSRETEIFRQARLEVPIDKDRLTIEIEDLLRWIVSSCQRAVAQEQVDKETFDGQALLSIPVHQSNSRDRLFPANRPAKRGETLIEAFKFRALGIFKIELSIAGSGRYPVGSDAITVCSIHDDQQRTIGLMVSFALHTPPFRARISPHIRTFNVVPIRTSIIEYITTNDLEGIQKLFAGGQASPLDVDPRRNSLLQVSETHLSGNVHSDSRLSTPCASDSAAFRLVLGCGAGVPTFRYSTYEADFIWTLWTDYVNYVRIPGAPRMGTIWTRVHIVILSGLVSIQVLKERSKFKTLVLLKAGCDPNLPDRAGETPHQYAERNSLFPQWKWVLIKNGYMLDDNSGQWVK